MSKKIKKLFSELKGDIKHLNKIISIIHKKTNKMCIVLFFDILWCEVKYGTTGDEYNYFEFYLIDSSKRSTYLSEYDHNSKHKYFVNDKITNVILNKEKFNSRFKKYVNETNNINYLSYKEFEVLLSNNKKIISRSKSNNFVDSFKVYDSSNFRGPGFLLEKLKTNKLFIVEKFFSQHKLLDKISEDLVVINVVTMNINKKVDIVSMTIDFKNDDKVIKGFIDLKKGITKGHFRYKTNEIFNDKVIEYKIPCFEELKEHASNLASELDETREVEWSFCINDKNKIILMDANNWNDTIFVQNPEYLNKKIGLMPYYKKILSHIKKY